MTTALLLIVLIAVAIWTTLAAVHTDRPKTAPRYHTVDPDFQPRSSLPASRWP